MITDAAIQQCFNRTVSAYREEATASITFLRTAVVTSGGISISDAREITVHPAIGPIASDSEAPRLVLGLTPLFDPFRDLELQGHWRDEGGLQLELRGGPEFETAVPSASRSDGDVIAFGITRYHIRPKSDGEGLAFQLEPSRWYRGVSTLWFTYLRFTATCMPQVVVLEGRSNRRLVLTYDEGFGETPVLSHVAFTETLPRSGRLLTLDISFSLVEIVHSRHTGTGP
jgi:hypothetical protein